jgi:tripartite ATP-independent transporter DctP family solute receptor
LNRREFLAVMTATAAAAGVPKIAAAQQSQKLKFGYILAPESQLGAGAGVFAAEIAKRTSGRFSIEQFPNSALGGEVEMLKAMQTGTIDMAFITGAPLPTVLPEVGVFNIPFLFRDAAHAHATLDGPIGGKALAGFKSKDLVALAWGENGMRHITNSKRPIVSADDLKGLKLRLPQSDVMMAAFKAMGADVSALAFPQLYAALQTGQFDGQENPIATIQASKFYQVQKYLTLSGHVYDPAVVFISPDVFGDLSDADKAAFVEAAKLAGQASRKFAGEAQAKGVAALESSGMQVTKEIKRDSFVSAMAAAIPGYETQFGKDLINQIRGVAST